MLFSLEKQELFCFYDKVKRLAVISFQNALSEEKLETVKGWLENLQASKMPLVGVLCDLRNVRRISFAKNLLELGKELPIAFIILHPYQSTGIDSASSPEQ